MTNDELERVLYNFDCSQCMSRKSIAKSVAKIHPRFALEKAEIRYLSANGWLMYCGTMTPWAESSDVETRMPNFKTHEEALAIQKSREP
jgi:hypothetical protein